MLAYNRTHAVQLTAKPRPTAVMTRVSKIFSGAMSALLTTASVSLSYLCLYTAYSKQSKALELGLLLDTLLVRRNLTHTLLELNKAISLAGLTVLALAFAPGFELQAAALRLHALVLLVLHSALSFNKLYGSKLFPDIKQLSKAGSDRMLALKFGSIFLAGCVLKQCCRGAH